MPKIAQQFGDHVPLSEGWGTMPRKLPTKEIDESLRFADACLASENVRVDRPEVRADARAALRGEITFDEAVRRERSQRCGNSQIDTRVAGLITV